MTASPRPRSLVRHLDLAADRADAGHHGAAARLAATVGKDVGACLGRRQQDVVHGIIVDAEPAESIAEDAAHDRDAECLALEHQAELHIRNRLHSRLATRTHHRVIPR
jgi:hypothetical protein